jgi:hypothetical protein
MRLGDSELCEDFEREFFTEADIHIEDEIAEADDEWEAQIADRRCPAGCTEHIHSERWLLS